MSSFKSDECFICGRTMTFDDMNNCRVMSDFDPKAPFAHNLCWDRMMEYARYTGWIK